MNEGKDTPMCKVMESLDSGRGSGEPVKLLDRSDVLYGKCSGNDADSRVLNQLKFMEGLEQKT